MDVQSSVKFLQKYNNYIILTHKNPDGDTVGSAGALCSALRRTGKTAWLYNNSQISEKLGAYVKDFIAPEDFKPRYSLSVDIASEGLFPLGFEGAVHFCADHHPSNSKYAKRLLLCEDKASCGEIVLELIKALCGDVSAEEATLLYIAVSTDTGCFQYLNTKADTLHAAAELVSLGADSGRVNQEFFRKVSPARIKLEGLVYAGMEFYREGKISLATISRAMLAESGAKDEDLDDLAGLAGRVEGSQLSITLRELEDGGCRISLRSGAEVNSGEICAFFGGGGHAMAAGCTIDNTPQKAKEVLLSVINEVWK